MRPSSGQQRPLPTAAVSADLARLEAEVGQAADPLAPRARLADLGEAAATTVLRRAWEQRHAVRSLSAYANAPGLGLTCAVNAARQVHKDGGKEAKQKEEKKKAKNKTFIPSMRKQTLHELSPTPIAKCNSLNVLESEDGNVLLISDSLNKSRTLGNGYSNTVCKHFMVGFPYWWQSCNLRYPKLTNSDTGCQPCSSNTSNSGVEHLDSDRTSLISKHPDGLKSSSRNDSVFPKSSHLSNGTPRFEEHTCDDDIATNEIAAASSEAGKGGQTIPVVTLEVQNCHKETQHIALTEKAAVDKDMPTSVYLDVENSFFLSNEAPILEEYTCDGDIPTNEDPAASNDDNERYTVPSKEVNNVEISLIAGNTSSERGHDDIASDVCLAPPVECSNNAVSEAVDSSPAKGTYPKKTPVASLKNQSSWEENQHIASNKKMKLIDLCLGKQPVCRPKKQIFPHEKRLSATRSQGTRSAVSYKDGSKLYPSIIFKTLSSPRVSLSKSKLQRNPSVMERISIVAEAAERVSNLIDQRIKVCLKACPRIIGLLKSSQIQPRQYCHPTRVAIKHSDMDDFMSARMILAGIQPEDEAYLQYQLALMTKEERKHIQQGKILIDDCFYLMGTTDPTGTLKPDEVCVIHGNRQVSGKVLVYKHPGLHFGDIHMLTATHINGLEEIVGNSKYAIFFPTSGSRSLADEMANSNFDGDMYWVSWNPQLVEHFKPGKPWEQRIQAKKTKQENPQDYDGPELESLLFCEFLRARFSPSYVLGTAVNCWLTLMDRLLTPEVSVSEKDSIKIKMLELVDIYYLALDAPKSGNEIEIPEYLMVKEYPHFLEQRPLYHSTSLLGKMYDESKLHQLETVPPTNSSPQMLYSAKKHGRSGSGNSHQEYKQILYEAEEFEESPRSHSHSDLFKEACAVYQVVYEHAMYRNDVSMCGFAWKVAGRALWELYLLKRGGDGETVTCLRCVLKDALKRRA